MNKINTILSKVKFEPFLSKIKNQEVKFDLKNRIQPSRYKIQIYPLYGRGIETTHTSLLVKTDDQAIQRGREIWADTFIGYKKEIKIYDMEGKIIFTHAD